MTKFVDNAELSVNDGGLSSVVGEERTFCFVVGSEPPQLRPAKAVQ